MQRMKATISYDGSGFSGYQVQPDQRTVQSELESALRKMHKGTPVKVTGSGRTDAGVHAAGQVIHFDTPYSIKEENWIKALNTMLPDDIVILKVEQVPEDFHARFDVKKKEYRYRVLRTEKPNVFKRAFTYHYPYQLDVGAIEKAAAYILGEHDFSSFCSAKTEVNDKVRTIYEAEIIVEENELVFRFVGNGFLYNMVRILGGTFLEVGSGKRSADDLPAIIESKERSNAGKTAPAHGLYLWSVTY
ncbi:tRNA pseudouridine(38-40) synthase TruA [Pseudalkalibacillus caeni]|uniref:tRNA pseudouridine synthase A n=1 Tax=Exobacillus caeni TaxID=2574798 RepID=A0A5R9EZ67_9BACL|nr:tRNA pseudouridine(38-40) synthase TruA [Pseudalkalibacillus caeni]TLS35486.1 tRNA pseudouridine(38-40) synthase TruA [Pseudalkalibacillus caeni]